MRLLDIITAGSIDYSATITIIDATDGSAEQAVEHDTSGIALWYRRKGAAKVAITPAELSALTDAHADGGIEHIDDGAYRLDLPDAAVDEGSPYVDIGGTVTGMIVIGGRIRLTEDNLDDDDTEGDDDGDVQDIGVREEDSTFYVQFQEKIAGSPVTPSSVTVTVYKNGSTTEIPDTTGITATIDFASNTGLVVLTLDTSNDTGKSGWWVKSASYLVKATSTVPSAVYGKAAVTKERYWRFTLGDTDGVGDFSAVPSGAADVIPKLEANLTSTAGTAVNLRVTCVDANGARVDLSAYTTATASITIYPFGSGVALFTQAFAKTDIRNNGFEKQKTTPSFADDTQYVVTGSVVLDGTTYNLPDDSIVVFG